MLRGGILLGLVLLAAASGAEPAGETRLGIEAWERGHYQEALVFLLPRAEQGDPEAQYVVGRMHRAGQGVRVSYVQAVFWFRHAAESGHLPAQEMMGLLHQHGLGVRRDIAEAIRWYRSAADRGFGNAQYRLGLLYKLGLLVRPDPVEAYFWLSLAAAGPGEHADEADNAREDLALFMTPTELASARRRLRDWRPLGER